MLANMNYANMIEEKSLKKTFIIATLISTIIGTFTTGISLYERFDQKRQQQKTDHEQDSKIKNLQKQVEEAETARNKHKKGEEELRRSLDGSGPVIRRQYDRDFERLGSRFAVGDAITQTQLQSQVITLQGTVINLLQDALYTGRLDNIQKLYNASEFAREGTLGALQQQYQRMLQQAPIRRGLAPKPIRRISSTPTMRTIMPSSAREDDNVANEGLDSSGPLFCRYAIVLQGSRTPLDVRFSKGGSCACPLCDTNIGVQEGRAWKIVKEVVHERISTPKYDDEIIESRIFFVNNRFVVKSHRERGGFACIFCSRHRERDTLCESANGLVKHIWHRHGAEEYEGEDDITEVSSKSAHLSHRG